MELKDLLGKHVITGCQCGSIAAKEEWQDSSNTIDFILDGKALSVVEDPDDGYRSIMGELLEGRDGLIITNTFPPCEVVGVMRADDDYENNDIVDFVDSMTGKIVLSVGTGNCDDYYPYFVGEFHPENMAVNSGA